MSSWSSARNKNSTAKLKSNEVWVKLDDEPDDDDDIEEEETEETSNENKMEVAKQKIKGLFSKDDMDEKDNKDEKDGFDNDRPLGDKIKKVIPFGISSGCMLGGMLSMFDVYNVITRKGQSRAVKMRSIARSISLNMLYLSG